MFSRKRPEPAKRRQHDLSQFGLTEIPDDFDPSAGYGDDDAGDSDLEAELAAITSGGGRSKPKVKPKPQLLPSSDLDRMIADSLRDVSDDDDDDALENDSDLLGELHGIAGDGIEDDEETPAAAAAPPAAAVEPEPVQTFLPTTTVDTLGIINERIEMYKQAEANAKAAGESGKARRFARGLKTLQDLKKQSAGGKTINVDDIPPEVSVKPATAAVDGTVEEPMQPSRAAPLPPTPSTPPATSPAPAPAPAATPTEPAMPANPLVSEMRSRQAEYKSAAVQAKRSGDTAAAIQFLRVVKQFDVVVKMCEDGQEVDLSDMPPPPGEFLAFMAKMQGGAASAEPAAPEVSPAPAAPAPAAVEPPAAAPTSMLEALQQRLAKYKSVEEAAKAEDNTSKARRFGRIVKQFEDAIRQHKAGKPVAYDELPVPPGFGPLPTGNAMPAASAAAPAPTPPMSPTSPPATESTSAGGTPSSSGTVTPTVPRRKAPPPVEPKELTTRTSGNHQKSNLAEQQMKLLLERQKEFKIAAVAAKKAGEIDQAKEYLRIYKGFDSLLNAASSGLPVDLSTLPVPPSERDSLEASFAIVATDECDPGDDICEIGVRMEEQLAKQLMMCKNTRDHHKAMGDVAGMNRFENLALTVQKDLDLVRYSKRKNQTLPKFHYEKRSFNIVHCNTDLTDNELEIVVVRGINYNVPNPKDVDTYVRVEFPLLNDESFKTKTNVIKDTDTPDYDERFKVDIQRSNRQFQRIFRRHGVKFEIYSRGGFLRSDTLIGTVNVKLQQLETKCDIHDTYDLMDGRKQVGGKLEIKVRVRNPILTKQMEHIDEKWLVLDA
ncbi:coiled-coil and C2 domain-containing protein 1-like isoform X2 [Drosophila grimshawi]|uniref:Coiled-coil and C2 domain-containing protein 1-like n=1 Tax=Drosophila grimshawi TaxID=7222 RepID=B4JAD0_DROGR|nr:coiled-coil and C2 domain-containing protein 1-like isoform X2 [Drosophila grimshawi]EDW03801.1 GH10307 [Drosophila grimshawi]